MTRRLQNSFSVLAVIFATIQVLPVSRAKPETDPSATVAEIASPPSEVKALLQRCCADCHSHETRWPWYSKVAPVSWLTAVHVNDGRARLNFSCWAETDAVKRRVQLEGMVKAVDDGYMPPSSYQWLHRDAVLSDAEKKLLTTWLRSAAEQVR